MAGVSTAETGAVASGSTWIVPGGGGGASAATEELEWRLQAGRIPPKALLARQMFMRAVLKNDGDTRNNGR